MTARAPACHGSWRWFRPGSASAFIAATLDALAAQTYPNLEILISDDASSDGTADRVRALRRSRSPLPRRPPAAKPGLDGERERAPAGGPRRLPRLRLSGRPPRSRPTSSGASPRSRRNPRAVLAFSDIALVHQDGSRESISYTALDGVAGPLPARPAGRTAAGLVVDPEPRRVPRACRVARSAGCDAIAPASSRPTGRGCSR